MTDRLPLEVVLGGQVTVWRDALARLRDRLMEPRIGSPEVLPLCVFFAVGLLNFRRAAGQLARATGKKEVSDALDVFDRSLNPRTIAGIRNVLHYLHEYSIGAGRDRAPDDPPEKWIVRFDEVWNGPRELQNKRDFVIRIGDHRLSTNEAMIAVDKLRDAVVTAFRSRPP